MEDLIYKSENNKKDSAFSYEQYDLFMSSVICSVDMKEGFPKDCLSIKLSNMVDIDNPQATSYTKVITLPKTYFDQFKGLSLIGKSFRQALKILDDIERECRQRYTNSIEYRSRKAPIYYCGLFNPTE